MNNLKNFIYLLLWVSSTSIAENAPPVFQCSLSAKPPKNNSIEVSLNFTKKTANIYYICQSTDVKPGQNYKALWIAVDTKGQAPVNYKIDEKSFTVEKPLASSEIWRVQFSLSKPTHDWPAGQYQVQLYLNDTQIKAQDFFIQ